MKRNLVVLLVLCVAAVVSQNCVIKNFSVKQLQDGVGLTSADVTKHLQNEPVSFVDPSQHLWSCVDGRSQLGIVGTPGGDAGEFLMGLTLYNKYSRSIDNEQDILALFRAFMGQLPNYRQFYMHTDSHAMENLREVVADTITNFTLKYVKPSDQAYVMNLLTQPANIGCGHIKMTVLHPDEYQVPFNISTNFIRAYFDYLWNSNASLIRFHGEDYEVLEGNHTEQAVLSILGNPKAGSQCAKFAPAIVPRTSYNAFFVNHPRSVGAFRDLVAAFFAAQPSGLPASQFRTLMDTLATSQLTSTLGYLAKGKPVFEVTIDYEDQPADATTTGTPAKVAAGGNSATGVVVVIFILIGLVGGTIAAWFVYSKLLTNSKKSIKAQVPSPTPITSKRNLQSESVASTTIPLDELEDSDLPKKRNNNQQFIELEDV